MVNEEFGNKLKKLKSKNVTKKRKKSDISQYVKFILLFIIAVGLSFGAYNVFNTITAKSVEDAQKFEDSKKDAITSINEIFSKYPDDPQKIAYISKITEAKNSADIEKVVSGASTYINFKENQQKKIADIKDVCGTHYTECIYAQSIVSKIENAKSSEELINILTSDVLNKIQNEARDKYLEEKKHELEFGDYFSVNVGVTKKLMTKEEALNYISKMSLNELKQLSIKRVSFNLITLTVSASQCGKIPMEGDYIYIYNKGSLASQQQTTQQTNQTSVTATPSNTVEPIECVVNASYIVAKDISYSESKSMSSSVSDDGGSSSASSSSSISYSLSNINGILHATAVDKLDYNKIKDKFGNYGLKLNKIEDDTQIFDSDVQYLLILSVPSDAVPELISMNSDDIYIVRAG